MPQDIENKGNTAKDNKFQSYWVSQSQNCQTGQDQTEQIYSEECRYEVGKASAVPVPMTKEGPTMHAILGMLF